MKVLMKPVDMICINSREGRLTPLRFKWSEDGGDTRVIRIGRVLSCKEEKLAGNRMLVYVVESQLDDTERVFEMKYELSTMKWFLFKM